jgi:Ca2+-binding RTX toxin-like protein
MKIAIALAAALLAAAAAPAARAETVSFAPDGALVVTAADGETNRLGIQSDPFEQGRVVIFEGTEGVPLNAPADRCEPYLYFVACTWTPAAGVRVNLGDGDDWGSVSSGLPKTTPFTLAGGPGKDKLQSSLDGQPTTLDGGPGPDELDGGPGADVLLGGDDGDTLDGRGGPDQLLGGAGDDLLNGDANQQPAADLIDGGPGYDRMEDDWEGDVDRPVAVTLGGGADDGRPGEGDDVRNVERVVSHAASKLVGTDAGEYLQVFQVDEPSEIDAGGGDDTLKASDGADRLDGGPGNDDIDGGFGDDTIVGGPGQDTISGDLRGGDCGPLWCKLPFGNDTIDARDGERDSVSCGVGEDTVLADAVDVVAGDCEHVTRAGAPAGGGGSPTPGGGTTAGGLTAAAVRTRLGRALAHGLPLRVTAPGAGRLTARAKGAAGAAKVRRAGRVTVVLRFTKGARQRLRHARTARLTVGVRFAPAGGVALTKTLRVTLRR